MLVAIVIAALVARPHELSTESPPPTAKGAPAKPATAALDTVASEGTSRPVSGGIVHLGVHRKAELHGWAFAATPEYRPTGIESQMDAGARTIGTYFIERPDVAKVYNRPDAARSGYTISFESGSAGTHHLRLWLQFADGSTEPLDQRLTIETR